MEQNDDDDSCYYDALDDFHFYDCDSPEQSTSTFYEPSPDIPSPATALRRRRSSSHGSSEKNVSLIQTDGSRRYRERKHKIYSDTKENEKKLLSTESTGKSCDSEGNDKENESTVTTANDDNVRGSADLENELGDGDFWSPNLLVLVAGLLIKAIGFQFWLFFRLFNFPLLVFYCCYRFCVDPCGAAKYVKRLFAEKLICLLNLVCETLGVQYRDHKTLWMLVMRIGHGLFWSFYVGTVLFGLLVFSLMVSGFWMRYFVEEPIRIREELNFDFTKNSPVAFVPILSCDAAICGVDCRQKVGEFRRFQSRVIYTNHKLQVTVLMNLPESVYNRNLGIFQVRLDFLSADGKTLASKRQPCMLKFKSEPVRLFGTFLKVAPLVAGYVSESQALELKIRGYTEGEVPTSCLKVIIEPRAEYRPGAGIPELYDAFLILESELPLFKRMIWGWKRTIFVWISLISFMTELIFTLICCRFVIFPRTRTRGDSSIPNLAPSNQR